MCVAIYKPQNVAIPSDETFRKCWNANQDGAGIAFIRDGKIEIRKGFMKLQDFYNAIKILRLRDPELEKVPMFFHFRISTAGNVDGGNTHPFPITDDFKLQRTLDIQCKHIMMHNGILPIKPQKAHVSDTMEFIAMLYKTGYPVKNREEFHKLLSPLIGANKLAFMDSNGDTFILGDWQKDGDVFFSNMSWKYANEFSYYYKGGAKSAVGFGRGSYYDDDYDYYNQKGVKGNSKITPIVYNKKPPAIPTDVSTAQTQDEYISLMTEKRCPYCLGELVATKDAEVRGTSIRECAVCKTFWYVGSLPMFENALEDSKVAEEVKKETVSEK